MSNSVATKRELSRSVFICLLVLVTFVSLVFIAVPLNAQTGKAKVVTLRLVSGWTSPDMGNYGIEKLVNRINKEAKTVRIDFKGGGEVIPVFEAFTHISKGGMIDLAHTTPAFYAGNLPGALAEFNMIASARAMRESGFLEAFDKMHREKGVTVLSVGMWRGELHALFLNKMITTANLKGLKIRSSGMFEPILKKLGASTVTTAPNEIYTAMEKGVVDGFCYPYGAAFVEKSWYEVCKYVVNPQFPYQTSPALLANAKKWDALPQEVRKEVMDVILQLEDELYEYYKVEGPKSIKKLVDKGLLKEINLPPREAQIFVNASTEAMWDDIIRRAPDWGPKLKELGEKATKLQLQMDRKK